MTNENNNSTRIMDAVAIKAQTRDTRRAWLAVLAELGHAIRAYNIGKTDPALRFGVLGVDDRAMCDTADAAIRGWLDDLRDRVGLDTLAANAAATAYMRERCILRLMKGGARVERVGAGAVRVDGVNFEDAFRAFAALHADTSTTLDYNTPDHKAEQSARNAHDNAARCVLSSVALPDGFSRDYMDPRGMNSGGAEIVAGQWLAGLCATILCDENTGTWELYATSYDGMPEPEPIILGPVLTREVQARAVAIMREWIAARVAYLANEGN